MKPPGFLVYASVIAVAIALGVGIFARGESTRTTLNSLNTNIANRCIQGDDAACAKLRARLKVLTAREIKGLGWLRKGVDAGGGKSHSGRTGGRLSPRPRKQPASPAPAPVPPDSPGNSQICIPGVLPVLPAVCR